MAKYTNTSSEMPKSLYNQALDFIIEHIENVQTCSGIPELIGENIFHALVAHHLESSDRSKLTYGLKIFSETYGSLVLNSLNLKGQLLTINEYCECLIPMMLNLVSLDISNCHLGMNHEILQEFVKMNNLKTLNMKNCGMTDDALQKLTIPCRMYSKGFVDLQRLDLSCNPKLTMSSLKFLRCLKKLDVLLLSGTSITMADAEQFGSTCGFVLSVENFNGSWNVTTEGWAKSLIHHWIDVIKSPKTTSSPESKLQSTSFYLRCRMRLEMVKELKSSPPPKQMPHVCLIKRANFTKEIKGNQNVISKQPKYSPTEADSDLLNGYLGQHMTKMSHRRNLFEALDMSS